MRFEPRVVNIRELPQEEALDGPSAEVVSCKVNAVLGAVPWVDLGMHDVSVCD